MVALLIGVVCAVSQALSALLARSITSALLSYITVFALTVGTLIAFALLATIVTTQRSIETGTGAYIVEDSRTDLVWPVLAPNPFVVLIDSAPRVPPRILDTGEEIRIEDYDGSTREDQHNCLPVGRLGAFPDRNSWTPVRIMKVRRRVQAAIWPLVMLATRTAVP